MPRFLFWNYRYNKIDREDRIARLVLGEAVDVLILAETKIDVEVLLSRLNDGGRYFSTPSVPHKRIAVFAGCSEDCFADWKRDQDRLLLRKLKFPGCLEILLGAVHLSSGLHRDLAERNFACQPVAHELRLAQRTVGHSRTVVVGDFNLNPYDDGMVFTGGFGAMMSKGLMRRIAASRDERPSRFYNPMWSRMGREIENEPPGTYYYRSHRPANTYWNYLDQVLVGYDLIDRFPDDRFRILTSIPGDEGVVQQLIREKKTHWGIEVSDHLPILFDLDLQEET